MWYSHLQEKLKKNDLINYFGMSIKNIGDKKQSKGKPYIIYLFWIKKNLINLLNVIIWYSFTDITRSKPCKKCKIPEEIGKCQHIIMIMYTKHIFKLNIHFSPHWTYMWYVQTSGY